MSRYPGFWTGVQGGSSQAHRRHQGHYCIARIKHRTSIANPPQMTLWSRSREGRPSHPRCIEAVLGTQFEWVVTMAAQGQQGVADPPPPYGRGRGAAAANGMDGRRRSSLTKTGVSSLWQTVMGEGEEISASRHGCHLASTPARVTDPPPAPRRDKRRGRPARPSPSTPPAGFRNRTSEDGRPLWGPENGRVGGGGSHPGWRKFTLHPEWG